MEFLFAWATPGSMPPGARHHYIRVHACKSLAVYEQIPRRTPQNKHSAMLKEQTLTSCLSRDPTYGPGLWT